MSSRPRNASPRGDVVSRRIFIATRSARWRTASRREGRSWETIASLGSPDCCAAAKAAINQMFVHHDHTPLCDRHDTGIRRLDFGHWLSRPTSLGLLTPLRHDQNRAVGGNIRPLAFCSAARTSRYFCSLCPEPRGFRRGFEPRPTRIGSSRRLRSLGCMAVAACRHASIPRQCDTRRRDDGRFNWSMATQPLGYQAVKSRPDLSRPRTAPARVHDRGGVDLAAYQIGTFKAQGKSRDAEAGLLRSIGLLSPVRESATLIQSASDVGCCARAEAWRTSTRRFGPQPSHLGALAGDTERTARSGAKLCTRPSLAYLQTQIVPAPCRAFWSRVRCSRQPVASTRAELNFAATAVSSRSSP